jgi:tetratricopeptide (TPR) repeat protein
VLVDLGIMTVRDLQRFIRRQIETVIFELLSWQEGFFSFVEAPIDTDAIEGLTSIPTECLLMEGARRLDEWTQIQQRVPHLGVVPVLAEAGQAQPAPVLDLLPNEWEVLAIIDGERDVRTLAATLGRSEFEVAKIVFGLLTTGVIALVATAEAPPATTDDWAAALAAAREAMVANRLDEALTAAESAVAAAPGSAEARTVLARVLFRAGREAEGEEELRLALEADALNPDALMESARVAARRGQLSKAIRHWQQVVAACPDTPAAEQARHAAAHASRLAAVLEAADA